MDLAITPVVLIAALAVLVGALGVGAVVLIRLRVFTRYAFNKDRPEEEESDYHLGQSYQAGE